MPLRLAKIRRFPFPPPSLPLFPHPDLNILNPAAGKSLVAVPSAPRRLHWKAVRPTATDRTTCEEGREGGGAWVPGSAFAGAGAAFPYFAPSSHGDRGIMSSGRPRAGKIGEENEVAEGEEEGDEGRKARKEEGGKRRFQPASSEAGCGSTAAAGKGGGAAGNRAPSPSFQTSSAKAKSGGRGDAGISNGDWPRVNGALNMTVSGTENSGSYDDGAATAVAEGSPASTEVAVAATARAPSSVSSSEEDDGDTPMNLSPGAGGGGDKEEDEAMNLCPPPTPLPAQVKKEREPVKTTTTFGMCAKMRLKKQRLEAFAAQEEQMKAAAAAAAVANVKNSSSMDPREMANGNAAASAAVAVTPASASGFASVAHENDQTSALHRLAEAAQRKQVRPR